MLIVCKYPSLFSFMIIIQRELSQLTDTIYRRKYSRSLLMLCFLRLCPLFLFAFGQCYGLFDISRLSITRYGTYYERKKAKFCTDYVVRKDCPYFALNGEL